MDIIKGINHIRPFPHLNSKMHALIHSLCCFVLIMTSTCIGGVRLRVVVVVFVVGVTAVKC